MMIEVVRAPELGAGHREVLAGLYVDAFADDLRWFSTDLRRLAPAFAPLLEPGLFHVALRDGVPAGLAARTDGRQQSIRVRTWPLARHLGVKGLIGSAVLRREFSGVLDLPPGTVSLEFVGTAAAQRGHGVATALLEHLMALPGADAFVLADIADTNTAALSLYRGLGFAEYRRVPTTHAARTGIGAYISMRRGPDGGAAPGDQDGAVPGGAGG